MSDRDDLRVVTEVRARHEDAKSSTNCCRPGVIHLDTSALAKLIVRETETATLGRWLRQRDTELIAFCCYDRRLLDAARDTGLPIFALGT